MSRGLEWRRSIALAARNLFRHRLRTLVSLSAIAVGVAGIVLSGGFVQDVFVQLAEATIHSQSGHLQVAKSGFFSGGSRHPELFLLDDPALESGRIRSLPGVADVMARVTFSGLLNNGRADLPIVGEGVEPSKEAALGTFLTLTQGRSLEDHDEHGIMIGHGLARALKVGPGDRVTLLVSGAEGALNSVDLEVVGVFQTFSREHDARAIRIKLQAAQDLLGTAGANLLVVSLKQTSDTDRVAAVLRERSIWRGIEVRTWEELNAFYRSTVQLYGAQFRVLQAIVLCMVVLGVINAINMSVFERTGEFGTMRALGERSAHVFRLVLTEAALLGLIGAAAGVALGIALALLISHLGIPMPPPPNSDRGYTALIRIVPVVVLAAFAIGVIAALAACVLPAIRVSRRPIVEALRHNV